jgi:putative GTP pyrophosphokinase
MRLPVKTPRKEQTKQGIKMLGSGRVDQLIAEYERGLPDYRRLEEYCFHLVEALLAQRRFACHKIEHRVKEETRLRVKLRKVIEKARKAGRSSETVKLPSDVVGLRVITLYASERDAISEYLRSEFEVFKFEKKHSDVPSEFTYTAIHMDCGLKKERRRLRECRGFADLKFELQLQTIMEHAWAAVSHDLFYKPPPGTEPSMDDQRALWRAKSSVDELDITFDDLRKSIEKQQEGVEPLMQERLQEFVQTRPVKECERQIEKQASVEVSDFPHVSAYLLRLLSEIGFRSMGELSTALESERSAIVAAAVRRLNSMDPKPKRVSRGISLFYLLLLRAQKDEKASYLKRLFRQWGIGLPEERENAFNELVRSVSPVEDTTHVASSAEAGPVV